MPMETPDEIWAGDLFNRREEAEDLIGYLESVSTRPAIRDEGHAHVLAVDTSYGQGKSYFLRRLARHMAADHAVAFVDAWVDDLEDQPMVALAATLDKALEPWVKTNPDLANRMAAFRAKAGRVAKIVGVGLAKRAASFVIMGSGAEALGDALSGASEATQDLSKEALKDTGNNLVDDVAAGFGARMASSMEDRIARFREGQEAISEMKVGLSDIVETLLKAEMKLPITIIIDELDRCRPTYAIKVLEELKHLFDVPGVAFVLGMHGQQLSHSITAAYGVGFDSQAYLRRFFSRRYVLREAELAPLVKKLCYDLGIPLERLQVPRIGDASNSNNFLNRSTPEIIADYIRLYGLAARDAFPILEMLQTAMALTGDGPMLLPLLMPMIIAHVRDKPVESLSIENRLPWQFAFQTYNQGVSGIALLSTTDTFKEMNNAAKMHSRQLMNLMNKGGASPAVELVSELRFSGHGGIPLHDPSRYEAVLQKVARFTGEGVSLDTRV